MQVEVEFMSFEDIRAMYPNQWVLIGSYEPGSVLKYTRMIFSPVIP